MNDLLTKAALPFVFLLLLPGCIKESNTGPLTEQVEINVDSNTLTVIGHGAEPSMASTSYNGDWTYNFKGQRIEKLDHQLIINDLSYGTLQAESQIVVSNSVVYVDGIKLEPTPLTEERFEKKYPVSSHEFNTGKYNVMIRYRKPSWTIEKSLTGAFQITTGGMIIRIKGDKLYVNESMIRELMIGDEIQIDGVNVYVSEEKVWPLKQGSE